MRNLILTLLFLATLGATAALAAEDPKWEELNALLGLNIESEKVKQVVQAYNLTKSDKGGSGSFSPKHHAYALMFDRDEVSTIVLKVSRPEGYGDPGWRTYACDLPSQIKPSSRLEDLVTLLGKSHTKQGRSWISDGLDINALFGGDGLICELYVSQADLKMQKPAQQGAP